MSEETVVIEPPPAQLVVLIDDDAHTFDPSAHAVFVGIGTNGSIQIAPEAFTGPQVQLRKTGAYWTGLVSGHDILVDGQHRTSFAVSQPVSCRFPGKDQSVTFLTESHRRGQTAEVDPNILRAGRAAAQRREERGLTLRGLGRAQVMNPRWNARFENGEIWPGDDILAKLERAYGWPVGTLTRIRDGQEPPKDTVTVDNDATDLVVNTGQVPLMASAAQLALRAILPRIDALPGPDSPDLPSQAKTICEDLRRVEELCQRAAQHSRGVPELAGVLSDVRRAYRRVMLLAAQSPGAYLGQRLFAARHHSGLTVDEIAAAAAVPAGAVATAEAGGEVAPADQVALTHLLNHLAI
ncbi:helix-turn-helix domain-containing protein [Mycobacteroides abscessus]|uniref:helix-turn-helix domain-containing protein n=1 Tax=Mycobacteroides abscessus TaxID=36809 RepID=UPI0012FFF7CB|nr:helix-turn-helix domain-containing protein [Mycobacteroides abscessus]